MGDEIVKTPAVTNVPAVTNAPVVASSPVATTTPASNDAPIGEDPIWKKWYYWVGGAIVVVAIGLLIWKFVL